jgi:hypothetical protein
VTSIVFSPGQTVTFPDGGVSSFTITGIEPSVDGSSPTAFPIEVGLNTVGASVEATAYYQSASTPEPSSCLLFSVGLIFLGGRLRTRERQRDCESPSGLS